MKANVRKRGRTAQKKVSIWVIETLAFIRRCRTGEKISDSILCYSEVAFSFKKKLPVIID